MSLLNPVSHRSSPHSAAVRIIVPLLCLAALQCRADPVASTLADPDFEAVYRDYYAALVGFGSEDLRLELKETIEDVMTNGLHLTRPGLGHKRREITDVLLGGVRVALCSGSSADPDAIRRACVASTLDAAAAADVAVEPESVGMLAAVCARLITTPSLLQWCATP